MTPIIFQDVMAMHLMILYHSIGTCQLAKTTTNNAV